MPPSRRANSANSANSSATSGFGVGAVAGGALSGAGGTTIVQCPASDTSVYCSFVKGFNALKMLIYIIGLIAFIYYLYKALAPSFRKRR